MGEVLLQVEHLKKSYDSPPLFRKHGRRILAVDDVSFSIPKGSIMGLIGESGCGKSTIGKTMLGLTAPSGGRVCFCGVELFDADKGRFLPKKELQRLRKDMQIVFQDPYSALDPKRTVLDTVSEGAMKHGLVSRKDAYAYSLRYLNACGMDESALRRYPHEFSGGQRQRINIARSLAVDPKFLVCDEITAALDVSIQSQILNLLLELRETYGLTLLVIFHNIDVVHYLCDYVAVMYLGKIVEMADAKTLYQQAVHPYTKALLSAIPIREPGEEKERFPLKKTMPAAECLPEGCRFHTRCPECTEACRAAEPPLVEVAPGHLAACHI